MSSHRESETLSDLGFAPLSAEPQIGVLTLPMQRIHIVIPCYNEAERLPGDQLLEFLRMHAWASVSLVNDGSADDTIWVLERLRSQMPERIDVHDLPQNVGKAEAIRSGVLASLGRPFDFAAYLDADFSTLPETLGEMLQASESQHRFILGSRVLRAGAVIERSASRHYLGRVFATLASVALDLRLYDTQCGAKLIERSLVEPLFSEPFLSRWLFDLELLLRARHLLGDEGFTRGVIEVPVKRWVDKGESRVRLRDVFTVPYGLLRIRGHYRRLHRRRAQPALVSEARHGAASSRQAAEEIVRDSTSL